MALRARARHKQLAVAGVGEGEGWGLRGLADEADDTREVMPRANGVIVQVGT